ncbi:MAG: ATP-binding protein [Desulfovibrio sp.]|jgi:hypothetical protein|nr:ATP-binding protein [Desulfovibrio sp.]
MGANKAKGVINSLRLGTPPEGFVRHFTVGRINEIEELRQCLSNSESTVLLLKANYGAGKSHLIRYIREEALAQNYAVSVVTVDSKSAIRFNRMDQIWGAVCRNIECNMNYKETGIRYFFDMLKNSINKNDNNSFWYKLSNGWKWDYSEVLGSPALFIAVRAWLTGDVGTCSLIEDWLCTPWNYTSQRKKLYSEFIDKLRKFFRDPRPEWQFYNDGLFLFQPQGYAQSWKALSDLDHLARAAELKGLIILFDEFEDIITNLKNIKYQESAFWNLFEFYSGKKFSGKSFYAVTPEFADKCRQILQNKGKWGFDFTMFDKLPKFEMSPLENDHLINLGCRIAYAYKLAYQGDNQLKISKKDIEHLIYDVTKVQIQDRTRHAIKSVVKYLDGLLEDDE